MPKISVTMAFYNRPEHLRRSLWAYYHLHRSCDDYEFVIVDDLSAPDLTPEPVVAELSSRLNIRLYRRTSKSGRNPAVPINASVRLATSSAVVITNPETMPMTPVLESIAGMSDGLSGTYRVTPCFSVSPGNQALIDALDCTAPSYVEQVRHSIELTPRSAVFNGDDGWYEHSEYRPAGFYFLAAMDRDDFLDMGGIDEDFQFGVGREDTDFRRRLDIRGTRVTHLERNLCLHQHHYDCAASDYTLGRGVYDNFAIFDVKELLGDWRANVGRRWGVL